MGYIYIYRRAYGRYIYPKKLPFAAYGQFVLVSMYFRAGRNRSKSANISVQCKTSIPFLPYLVFV